MKDIQNLQVSDYLEILKRRTFWILIPAILAGICNYFYVKTVPDVFVSETVILVEPPKIPTEYVRSTASATIQTRLSTISQQILSRTRLEKIITDNGLYAEKRKQLPMEDVVEGMRKDIDLKVTKVDAFTLTYESYIPEVAQKVTSQLASLYIEENLKIREEQTEGVSQFLDSHLKLTETKLKELENQLTDFRRNNMGALPEQQSANVAVLNGLQQQLQASIDSTNRLEEQKTYQQRLLSELKSFGNLEKSLVGLGTQPTTSSSSPPVGFSDKELDTLKAQRNSLRRRYTKDHPDVRKLDLEIAQLERSSATSKRPETENLTPTVPIEPPVSQSDVESIQVKTQIELLTQQIKQGQREQQEIRGQIALYQARVNAVPRVEQMQKEISRDYDTTLKYYQTLLAKKNDAEMATNLEKRQKGEQFRIIDPASYPHRPSRPDRLKLNLLGLGVGLALGLGLSLILELSDDSIRSEHELASLTGLPILVTIPLISKIEHKSIDAPVGKLKRLRRFLPVSLSKT